MRSETKELENVYARDLNGHEIYIGDVPKSETGLKKPYFCLGCNKRMQAIIPISRRPYFRHHVEKNKSEVKCTYSDETYRHWLAKTTAATFKKIKVPGVFKYPPPGQEGSALLIAESKYIEAYSVKTECYVYEDYSGEIKVTDDLRQDKDKYLHIRPDTLFLDHAGKPILIVEFVATHKPDQKKLLKLKRLGINAIQVTVPKSSPEEIQSIFHTTIRTKWIYNNEEAKTDYIQFSKSYSGGVYEIDIEQRKLFEEGFVCRKAHLGEFIRRIGLLLEEESYTRIERDLNSEILRIEDAARIARDRLESIRNQHVKSGIGIHSERRETVGKRRTDLEKRYLAKITDIERDTNRTTESINDLRDQLERSHPSGEGVNEATARLRRETELLDIQLANIERFQGEEREIFNRSTEGIRSNISAIPETFESRRRDLESEFGILTENQSFLVEQIEVEEKGIELKFESDRKELQRRLREDEAKFLSELESGESEGNGGIAQEYRRFYSFVESLKEYKSSHYIIERVERELKKKS